MFLRNLQFFKLITLFGQLVEIYKFHKVKDIIKLHVNLKS